MRPSVATVGCVLLLAACAPAAGAARARVAPRQELVAVLAAHQVRARPRIHSRALALVSARRPITGERTILPVLARRTDRRGASWIDVRLPGRVLGATAPPRSGWISAARTHSETTTWHILVELASRRVVLYRHGRRVRTYRAIVGKPSTPTPVGDYFVEENVRLLAGAPGGPFALATSARSHVLQEFDGGPGQIALHGLDNVGGALGSAASHGCVRLADGAVTWLAARIGPGVPVTIVRHAR